MNPLPTEASRASDEPMIERIAREMAEQWRNGQRPLAETFLDRHPELWLHPDDSLELIAEELALRQDYDCPITPSKLTRRFPQWSEQVLALLDCQRAFEPHLLAPRFPEPGDDLDGFHLVSELGRGAHGRVFLANQASLASRPVVLKVSPDAGTEHLSLARLQHSHIVPLYSAHEFPDRGLRGLCLPYFGGVSLAEIQNRLGKMPTRSGGRDLLTALGDDSTAGPARAFLAQATFEEAVCWIGACLADALQYAHDRGVLHLDIKPSNVLLAADGVPMLLDFHLAHPPVAAGDPPPPWLGGTPGYMAPEQSFALDAVREGRAIAKPVDGRADIYALGVLLRELLHDRPGISSGLHDILTRCTAPLASARYATASELASDFRRQLGDLPLKGVRNRSLTERLGKWRRRRPYALPLMLAIGSILAAGAGFGLHAKRLAERARTVKGDAEGHMRRGQFEEAVEAYRGGESLLEGLPFHGSLRAELHDGKRTAERAHSAVELHRFCNVVRPIFDTDPGSSSQTRRLERLCRELWDRRDSQVAKLNGQPSAELERQWRADLLDIAILVSRFEERHSENGHRAALATLDRAEQLLGESAALLLERARHARSLGLEELANAATKRSQAFTDMSAWDHLAVGRSYLASGDTERAALEFDRCLNSDPRNFWAHYYRGVCEMKRGRPLEAIAAFSAACALAPDAAWCLHNRGLAYIEAGRFDAALADFDRALTLDPALSAAHFGRSTAHFRSNQFPEALADLDRAAEGGVPASEVLYRKAVVLNATGDRTAAIAHLRECLKTEPEHRDAKELLDRLTKSQ